MHKTFGIGFALLVVALIGIAATIPTSSLITRDLRINNRTDTVGVTIQKGTVTSNLVEAFVGSTLKFAVPADGVLDPAYGGTGTALTDPGADRILFWDDSATNTAHLTAGTGLSITDTTLAISTVPVANGGTGGSTAATGRTGLGIQVGSVTTAADGTVTNTFSPAYSVAPIVLPVQTGADTSVTNTVTVTTTNVIFVTNEAATVIKFVAIGTP
jgi:hypothetical protein